MTDIPALIARVRALDAAATKGPWSFAVTDAVRDEALPCEPLKESPDGHYPMRHCMSRTDAALIAYYRTAAPLLAAECERLRRALEDIAGYEVPTFGEVALQVCRDMRDDAFDALKGTR